MAIIVHLLAPIFEVRNLSQAWLNHANFEGAILVDVDLSQSSLTQAQMPNMDARRARFHRSSCEQADFSHADLSHADLTLANFNRCIFHKTCHQDANWKGSIKVGASWDDEARAKAESWRIPSQIQQEIEQALNEPDKRVTL
ncbi:pentapeptide repeat-containing protein [Vibrio sinus]|uniref:pentapeptide repeat-containing protein n=1 Tax=Vibrio sinus TaxID=2946865 RepID=UPI003D7E351E